MERVLRYSTRHFCHLLPILLWPHSCRETLLLICFMILISLCACTHIICKSWNEDLSICMTLSFVLCSANLTYSSRALDLPCIIVDCSFQGCSWVWCVVEKHASQTIKKFVGFANCLSTFETKCHLIDWVKTVSWRDAMAGACASGRIRYSGLFLD